MADQQDPLEQDLVEQVEIERKYDVDPDAALPDLTVVPDVARTETLREVVQTATYLDTADLRLLRARITLRRRVGGHDDGWHLKLPGDGERRTEIHLPPGAPGDVPPELVRRVRVHARRDPLDPVAELTTRRTLHRLLDADGAVLAEVCDDRVTAQAAASPTGEAWREWEVELVTGDPGLLDEVGALLEAAGAVASSSRSKLARVLAERVPVEVAAVAAPLDEEPSTGALLLSYLRIQVGRLMDQDLRFRAGEPEAVHQLRVAARRMRSALASYRPVLRPGASELLEGELRWLGSALGGARDAQVLQQRLDALLDTHPDDLDVEPVRARIDADLAARAAEGRRTGEEALNGERYLDLLDALDAFLLDPPFTDAAEEDAVTGAPPLLDTARKRIRRRHRAWTEATDPHERQRLLHDVRKAAKRLRYAAETVQPVFGKRAVRLAERARDLQELLGEHQDLTVARAYLHEAATRAQDSGEDAFAYGHLHALEEAQAEAIVAAYPDVLARLPRRPLRRWLRH